MEQQLEQRHRTPAARVAFDTEQRIKGTLRGMHEAWVALAREFYDFYEAKMYRDLGYDSLDEWAHQPDVDVSPRWVYELVQLWRELVVKRDVDPSQIKALQASKISAVLPAVRRGQVTVQQALSDAEVLGRGDLRERYGDKREARDPSTDTGRMHDAEKAFWECPTCGQLVFKRREAV